MVVLAFVLAGCGGGMETVVVTESRPADQSDEAPNTSPALTNQWPARWCEVKIGDSRKEVTRLMDSYPTEQNSHKIPLIPPIHINESGEAEGSAPPMPAGSDTWEAPGTYQFNAFYDRSQRVQQLDFSGPERKLGCAAIRIG